MRRLAFASVLAFAGCGDGGKDEGGDAFPRACDASEVDGDCVLYAGPGWTAGDVQENCVAGTLLPECPPAAAVGACTLDPGEFETVTTFYTPYWNGSSAIGECADAGGDFAEP